MPRTFPRSKYVNLSYERGFGACAANQEMHIAAQQNIFTANKETAKYSKTSVQPIRREKIKQSRRDRPRSTRLSLGLPPPLSWRIGLKFVYPDRPHQCRHLASSA
jgi:hypothetical protein